jgi:two-component system, NtrC family, sensor histidine kinase HydH
VTVSTRRGLGEVTVAVSDTGCGMDARTQELALKEFYTTKSTGSGLGLAFVRRVAEAHRGRLGISSREQEGTTVRLSLPV